MTRSLAVFSSASWAAWVSRVAVDLGLLDIRVAGARDPVGVLALADEARARLVRRHRLQLDFGLSISAR